jgi:hypothetical protein
MTHKPVDNIELLIGKLSAPAETILNQPFLIGYNFWPTLQAPNAPQQSLNAF